MCVYVFMDGWMDGWMDACLPACLLSLCLSEAPAFTGKTTPHVLTIKSKGFPGIITGFFLGAKPQISRNEKFIGPKWKKTPVYLQPGDSNILKPCSEIEQLVIQAIPRCR